MFDAVTAQDIHPAPLPHAAARCMRACANADHAAAEALWASSGGRNSQCRKRRCYRLKHRAAACEANAQALAGEVR